MSTYPETASSIVVYLYLALEGSPFLCYFPKFQLLLFLASESKSFFVKSIRELIYFKMFTIMFYTVALSHLDDK